MAYVSLADLKRYIGNKNASTFTADAGTDQLTLAEMRVANWLYTKSQVVVSSTTTLPSPLQADSVYYVIKVADNKIKLATSSANAEAGTQIDITDAGTGTHTLTRATTDDTLLQDILDAAETYINTKTGKSFEADTQTRYYRECDVDGLVLHLDEDLLTVTTLREGDAEETADKSVIPATDYWLQQRNDGPPYDSIELKVNSTHSWTFTTDGQIEVVGTWGFSETAPADIVQAVKILSDYLYTQKDSGVYDVVSAPEAGVITIPSGIPKTVTRIITSYRNPLG